MTLLNFFGSKAVGEAEEGIVAFKVAILFPVCNSWIVERKD